MNDLKFITITNLKETNMIFNNDLILIPSPMIIEHSKEENYYLLNKNSKALFYNTNQEEKYLEDINYYINFVSTINLSKALSNEGNNLQNFIEKDFINLHKGTLKEESYLIKVENCNLMICAISEKGLFYGVQTLIQLLKNGISMDNPGKLKKKESVIAIPVPKVTIIDEPGLKVRGVAQDVSRGQVSTTENALRYIRILSHYKLNFYCLYIEDMFHHPKYPQIGKDRGALSLEEIRKIDNYAKERFITLVPIFETLGHVDNILMHEDYQNLAEYPGSQCFNIVNEEVYLLLEDYIERMSKAFSSSYFHIGCDESFDFGKYRSQDYIHKVGKPKAYIDFYERMFSLVKKNGKKFMIMYDDIVVNDEEILKNLNKEIILMQWDYQPRKTYPKVKKLLDAGFKVIVSPSMLNWQRAFPDNLNAYLNMKNLIREAHLYKKKGCLGALVSTWGDFRYYSLRENEIFGAILCSSLAWNYNDLELDELISKFAFLFYGFDHECLDKFVHLFIKLSSSAKLYYKSNILLPPFFYTYLFKHPFPTIDYKPSLRKYNHLIDLGNHCLSLWDDINLTIKYEKENFKYIKFAAEIIKILGEKLLISATISKELKKSRISDIDTAKIIPELKHIKLQFIYLKEQYAKLWLKSAKEPCLPVILKLFDFVIEAYDLKIKQIHSKVKFEDPYLPSEWIWVNEKLCPKQPRFFRKKISLNGSISKAVIQCAGNNQMKVFINSNYVGEVLSRFSLSILPIIKRVRIFDITKYLQKGENQIAIEAYNFDGYKGAINLYGMIEQPNEIIEVKTDTTWLCNAKNVGMNDWKALVYDDSDWKKVKSYGKPPALNGDLFKTDLLNGKVSITQDYFGLQGFFNNAVNTFVEYFFGKFYNIFGKFLIKTIKFFVQLLIKRIRPFD